MDKRTLTFVFERSVDASIPETIEVTVSPLVTTVNSAEGTVVFGGAQTRVVLLANDTVSVSFDLIPSEHPDLDEVITYRVAWRERYGRHQYTSDFTMPDQDISFSALAGLGRILSAR